VTANDRPRGRDEVRAAILAAARRRFATEGPAASTRDIAADANVNLGLLHRHFGSKDQLIRAVFADVAERGFAKIEAAETFDEALACIFAGALDREDTYARMLAGALLAGRQPSELQNEFPTIRRLVDLGGADSRGRILLAMLVVFGWHVFADFLVDAIGYENRNDAASDVSALLKQLESPAITD
jgi:AcrR family transcriptional regulator